MAPNTPISASDPPTVSAVLGSNTDVARHPAVEDRTYS
eukprot:CAMPEP_0197609954 /NCGR_PEP_ID=MMETSP1326-20131121/52299_1 /TAXON_ID=1155430 /ORGANISM="Genus nov. species nov., Strain RCC2288" /LENGTH=37 /DNA_ID= /DNA_START= /DNA_END= /DNA_ORIENTATION=